MYIVSPFTRYFLCLIPYIILFSNKEIIYHITGPITIPPFKQEKDNLLYFIAGIELFRVFYQPLINFLILILTKFKIIDEEQQNLKLGLHSMTVKYLFVLFMKLFVIFYETHRLKYYLHVFFLELFIVAVNVLADVVNNPKVSLVMDIVLIDSLNRVALFYQLTRTFNPNFGLYFFGNNLITLICFMLEGNRKQVLYVRHDIYRIMIVTFGYLLLFSLLQSSITYRPLIILIFTSYFFLKSIQSFSNDTLNNTNELKSEDQKLDFLELHKRVCLFLFKGRKVNYFSQIRVNLKEYFIKIRENSAFLYFLYLISITIGLQFLFIQINSTIQQNENLISQQTVRNSFMEFYIKMKSGSFT